MKRLLFLVLIWACSGHAENETLKKAAEVHNEAVEIGHKASLLVSQLKQMEDSISVAHRDSLQSVISSLSEWYETLVEVPGYDHEDEHGHEGHDHSGHDHHHDHDHGGDVNYLEGLSPEEVLEVQEALKREVQQIERRASTIARDIQNASQP